MKKIRYPAVFAVVLLLLCLCSFVTFAKDVPETIVSLQIDNPIMEINGAKVEIDAGRNTTPVIKGGRTLVPIRAIIEAFGGAVGWEESTRTVHLALDDDTIRLVIDQNTAYLNNKAYTLDVAPAIIDGRTMLPIRFVAEGFNLGVAWDAKERTVSVVSDTFSDAEYNELVNLIPQYSGYPCAYVNNNIPFFENYEIIGGSFEYYAELDELGRCDVCFASVAPDIMPIEERESISSVTPTGWINKSYDNVDGGYLYSRCHLIGFQLTGENANERNLITGTRYLNIEGMLPFENAIAEYVETTQNHVMYRATPVFSGSNLVADGVLLEAYSVEDNGSGISFCVYCYNVQPQIVIDYQTGASSDTASDTENSSVASGIYRTPTGKRYHFDAECGGKNSYEVTLEEAESAGLTPCSKCVK